MPAHTRRHTPHDTMKELEDTELMRHTPPTPARRGACLRVLSCNVRCSPAQDGANAWELRRALCLRVIKNATPDIIAAQEVHADQFACIMEGLRGYAWHSMDDEPGVARPVNTIWYRRARFDLQGAGGYFLSATPHVCGSKSWDSSLPRLAVWVLLRDRKNGARVRVIATHLDHIGHEARVQQARLLCEDAERYPEGVPQILLGDMNADAHHPALQTLLARGWRDSYEAVHHTLTPGFTFHAFLGPRYPASLRPGDVLDDKIDWILTRGALQARTAHIVQDECNGTFPSDHYFLSSTLEYTC